MNILLLGSGGREHALAWKIHQSPKCSKLYISPGNPGTATLGQNVNIESDNIDQLANFIQDHAIEMLVVGPEQPLVDGIVDRIAAHSAIKHVPVIGPSKAAAQLEGSKDFSKKFMIDHDIPTAVYKTFNGESLQDGLEYINSKPGPYVLKADGLAGGKGVLIINNKQEAKNALSEMLDGKFGNASSNVVIEDFLSGLEFSVFVMTDGINYKILPTAKDYKRVGVGDTGLNTGGMGAVSPVPFVDATMMQKVLDRVVEPTLRGMRSNEMPYKGFLYCGLISVDGEPFVIEYNCRMGDPETEVVMPLIESDLVDLFEGIASEKLDEQEIVISKQSAATIILASAGYPGAYDTGKEIHGLDFETDALVFHAGTKQEDGKIKTNGGRVLAVTACGENLNDALANAHSAASKINFDGKYFRSDIGHDVIPYLVPPA